MIIKKFFSFFILIILIFTAGCATLPREEAILPTFNISGKIYIPLKNLCDLKGIDWQWDSFAQTVDLKKDNLRARVQVGASTAQINEKAIEIKSVPILYKGIVVVPTGFRQEVIAKLIKIAPSKEVSYIPIIPINRVVIDAGHGGKDPGAIGRYGLREKDITLDIVRRLKDELEAQGIEVVMTRESDRFISLARRSKIANTSKADLFISIHVNSSRARRIQGFEIYCLREFTDSVINKLANSGDFDYLFKNLAMNRSSRTVREILLDMIYTQNRAWALGLAQCISSSTARELSLKNRGIKSANFFVLKNTHIPAILIEIGFVSNAVEERYLKNSFYRRQLAESLAQGLLNFQKSRKLHER
ncbi:MAG: N-acetylmuramoyl-L-alanine amidase [Candidatus Omnitrophota bacterium]|nr:N-acetylmuramoyl-L-alanine amidase [Candidatus Omnitrophota bacterium]